jgi:hypothetical protein
MSYDLTPAAARAALADADRSAERLRRRARWAGTKLAVCGLGMGLVTLSIGLVGSRWLGAAVFVAWGLLVLGVSRWERRRTAHLPGTAERTRRYWTPSFALYAVAIAAGNRTEGDPAYWGTAAVLVAVPLLVGAVRETRA